jgi:cold shock protein
MGTGTLKKWDANRGFGFIQDDAGGPDIFLHVVAVKVAGLDPHAVIVGTRLSFSLEPTRDGRTRAGNVQIL